MSKPFRVFEFRILKNDFVNKNYEIEVCERGARVFRATQRSGDPENDSIVFKHKWMTSIRDIQGLSKYLQLIELMDEGDILNFEEGGVYWEVK